MVVRMAKSCGAAALLLILASGCSSTSTETASLDRLGEPTEQCRRSPASCMYNGAYEPGERAFAEREAARLNRASLERLRRQAAR